MPSQGGSVTFTQKLICWMKMGMIKAGKYGILVFYREEGELFSQFLWKYKEWKDVFFGDINP